MRSAPSCRDAETHRGGSWCDGKAVDLTGLHARGAAGEGWGRAGEAGGLARLGRLVEVSLRDGGDGNGAVVRNLSVDDVAEGDNRGLDGAAKDVAAAHAGD